MKNRRTLQNSSLPLMVNDTSELKYDALLCMFLIENPGARMDEYLKWRDDILKKNNMMLIEEEIMFNKEEYIDRMRSIMTIHHLTFSDLHRDMQMAYTTVQKILSEDNESAWSSKTIKKVKEFLYRWENK